MHLALPTVQYFMNLSSFVECCQMAELYFHTSPPLFLVCLRAYDLGYSHAYSKITPCLINRNHYITHLWTIPGGVLDRATRNSWVNAVLNAFLSPTNINMYSSLDQQVRSPQVTGHCSVIQVRRYPEASELDCAEFKFL